MATEPGSSPLDIPRKPTTGRALMLAAFAAFGIDKRLAEAQERRISEATLLELAFFGGTLGAYAGRHVFRAAPALSSHVKAAVQFSGAVLQGAAPLCFVRTGSAR